jgi:hypothetical protein
MEDQMKNGIAFLMAALMGGNAMAQVDWSHQAVVTELNKSNQHLAEMSRNQQRQEYEARMRASDWRPTPLYDYVSDPRNPKSSVGIYVRPGSRR